MLLPNIFAIIYTMSDFSENLIHLRARLGLSQRKLAEDIGVSKTAIFCWEKDTAIPTADNIIALADYFGITTDELLGVERKNGQICQQSHFGLTTDEERLLKQYRKLSPALKAQTEGYVEALAERYDAAKTAT